MDDNTRPRTRRKKKEQIAEPDHLIPATVRGSIMEAVDLGNAGVASLERALLDAAEQLAHHFKEERTRLQVRDLEDRVREARERGQAIPTQYTYAPLSLVLRTRRNAESGTITMDLRWQLQHSSKVKKVAAKRRKSGWSPLPESTGKGFTASSSIPAVAGLMHMSTLLSHAKAFEFELVRETERQARGIRKAWRLNREVKESLQLLGANA